MEPRLFGARCLVCALAAWFGGAASAQAQDVVFLPALGGTGGYQFQDRCNDGGFLVGIRVYAGEWIDNIQMICARRDPATGKMIDPQPEGVWGGANGVTNQGNSEFNFPCTAADIVFGMDVAETRDHPFIGHISMTCMNSTRLMKPDIGAKRFSVSGSGPLKDDVSMSCPEGFAAVGIHGRIGIYVDAIGLICGHAGYDAVPPLMTIFFNPATPNVYHVEYPSIRVGKGSLTGSARLDWCREWASNCGEPAADAFCKQMDYGHALGFTMEEEPPLRTAVISSKQLCTGPGCNSFRSIVCRTTPFGELMRAFRQLIRVRRDDSVDYGGISDR